MYHFILILILEFSHTPLSLVHGIENYTPIFSFFYFLSIVGFGEFISQALGRT